jgi:hypothetical protein
LGGLFRLTVAACVLDRLLPAAQPTKENAAAMKIKTCVFTKSSIRLVLYYKVKGFLAPCLFDWVFERAGPLAAAAFGGTFGEWPGDHHPLRLGAGTRVGQDWGRSRLEPFRKPATTTQTLQTHWCGVAVFLETRVTNGLIEAIKGLLQLAKCMVRISALSNTSRLWPASKAAKPKPELPRFCSLETARGQSFAI